MNMHYQCYANMETPNFGDPGSHNCIDLWTPSSLELYGCGDSFMDLGTTTGKYTTGQGRRKRSGWYGLGRTNFRSLLGVAICDRDIGGCGNMLSARAACGSSCRTSKSCNKQLSGSSNARIKPRLKGKQRSIDHHLQSPISHLPASSFAKGPSERLKCWIEAASTADLVVGRSYTTMRAKTHYFAIRVY